MPAKPPAKKSIPASVLEVPAYRVPRLEKWQQEALEQGFFDWAVPSFEWVVTRQAMKALNIGRQSVLDLIGTGQLEARSKNITGERGDYLISRRSLLRYLLSTMHPESDRHSYATRLVQLIQSVGDEGILALAQQAVAQELERARSRKRIPFQK